MTTRTKKELALLTLSTLAALPIFGGLGLTMLGVIAW
ncbi:hypothetical protein FBZ94_104645 [Bradyrhizobium sacchari]|uniref:Uncharacterized protein n=1 Tax=Bradyrhizobium sacchari TaxID=1399419 RepID=A0A560JZM3_9BRAD|nr:hypothetical protein FBZ94_104645 [Bradyrhizobium sacchari]TWB73770.1 hypothetical protein FBZ95_10520 [Bradyrhizobium sacchari]